jgi:hypothetical protein
VLGVGAIALAWMFGRHRPALAPLLTRFFLPMILVLSLTAAGLGYYYSRVTGSPFLLPRRFSFAESRRGADLSLARRQAVAGISSQFNARLLCGVGSE